MRIVVRYLFCLCLLPVIIYFGILIWFAVGSRNSEFNQAIGVGDSFSGAFIALIIFILIFLVCGIGFFLFNCSIRLKWNLLKLPFTFCSIFVIVYFFALGAALYGI